MNRLSADWIKRKYIADVASILDIKLSHAFTFILLLVLLGSPTLVQTVSALEVVCTNPDFLPIVKEIGGNINVTSLMPPGSDPHSFSLSKSDADRLKNVDLIVLTNSELFSFEKKIRHEYQKKVIDFGDYAAEGAKLDSFPGFNYNPHGYWLKIDNAIAIAKAIEKRLSELSPDEKKKFSENFILFKAKMLELKRISKTVIKKHNASCVAVIPGVAYVAENFGLKVGAILLGEGLGFVSGSEYVEIQERLKSSEYSCIIVPESMKDSKAGEIAEQLSRDSGKPVVYVKFVVGSKDMNYSEIQLYNLLAFAKMFASKTNLEAGKSDFNLLTLVLILIASIEAVVIFILWRGLG